MTTRTGPWECGSDFHWMNLSAVSAEPAHPPHSQLYSYGRAALADLIKFGMDSRGWKRLWIPSYNCPEVVDAIFATGIDTAVYSATPFDPVAALTDIHKGDAIFIVNFFGVKSRAEYAAIYQLGIPVIEDHSHDPWSSWAMESRADYCIASYRKTLPIPDGGAVWSNTGLPLPSSTVENYATSTETGERMEAMLLKSLYLAGGIPEKKVYLSLFEQAKNAVTPRALNDRHVGKSISCVSREILKVFPWESWRKLRAGNHRHLLQKLSHCPDINILAPYGDEKCPFILTLLVSSRQKRDQVKQKLIERSIYPAVIWVLDRASCSWAGDRAVEISGRILGLQCDGRYSLADMDRVAIALSECINS